ncbi:MAG: hypothetical protein GXP55_20725 [Deltaproteobacteria bacterium]|nr:hypothetical protein [Deltaproteobacteria bacterium]
MARRLGWIGLSGVICVFATHTQAQTTVCVEVEIRSWAEESQASAGEDVEASARDEAVATSPASTPPPEANAAAGADGTAEPPEAQAPTRSIEEGALPDGSALGFQDDELAYSPPSTPRRTPRATTPINIGALRPQTQPPPTRAPAWQPAELDPASYLRRLLEYQVTHREGFETDRHTCSEHLMVQLYPLEQGYTVFARYTGTAREEKVDEVELDEFRALAQRLAAALLGDEPIESTLTRRTVLRADSEGSMRRIQGQRQFLFGIGTQLLVGYLPTARDATSPARNQIRLLAPLAINIGARRAFRAWAFDAYAGMLIGTSRKAASRARGGGHADYTFGVGMTLHFLRYLHPDAVNSFYGGGGASFQLHRYRMLPASGGGSQGLWSGGMNVDLVAGYELMRASALHFFIEAQVNAPAYEFDSENSNGQIRSYIPGVLVQIGILR